MSLRELIILLLGLAIVGIILRGLYVALQARRGQLRMAIDRNIPSDIDLEALELAELPGGGARVVSRDAAEEESAVSASLEAANQRAETFSLGIEDDAVPVLMDSVEVGQVAQFDATASNTSDDERFADDDWEPDGGDLAGVEAATYEVEPDTASQAEESVSAIRRREPPAGVTSQDLFDDEPGEKQHPRIGELASYDEPTVDALGEAADEYSRYDADVLDEAASDQEEWEDEDVGAMANYESSADFGDEIGTDDPASGLGFGEANEHPDDVLFDYGNDEIAETEGEETYSIAAEPGKVAGLHDQYQEESMIDPPYEDDTSEEPAFAGDRYEDDEEESNSSVFLSEHAHVEQAPQAEANTESTAALSQKNVNENASSAAHDEPFEQEWLDDYDAADENYDGSSDGSYDENFDENSYEEDAHNIADQPQASQAPEDEFADFSMTAGERIGGNPTAEKQAGLFDQFDESEQLASAQGRNAQRKPSLFATLKRRFTGSGAGHEELATSDAEQRIARPVNRAEPSPVDHEEDSFTGYAAGDDEAYEATAAQSTEPDSEIMPASESRPLQPAAVAQSYFDDQDELDWDDEEDTDSPNLLDAELEDEAIAEADNAYQRTDAESTLANRESRQIDWAGAARPEPRQQTPASQPSEIRQQTPAAQPAEVIVLNVVARGGREFRGDDLLEVLITSGLKFGEMNIFHQRFRGTNNGPVIFSVANILNPGTFDLNAIHEFSTVGVSLFLALPSPINNLEAFDQMLAVAQRIREELDGELKDDHRNVMTAQTIEHYRQRIRDFELRQLKAAGGRA